MKAVNGTVYYAVEGGLGYFHVVLFFMLHKVVLTFFSLWIKPQCVTIQMKAEQCFLVVLFFTPYKIILNLELVDKTIVYDH